jgi:hypothetical protein
VNRYYPPQHLAFEDHDQSQTPTARRPLADVLQSTAAHRHDYYSPERHEDPRGATPRERRARRHDDDAGKYDDDVRTGTLQGDESNDTDNERRAPRGDASAEETVRHYDKLDRQCERERARRQRREQRSRRARKSTLARRRHPTARTGYLDDHDVLAQRQRNGLRFDHAPRREFRRPFKRAKLPTASHLSDVGSVTFVATYSSPLRRFASGPLHGIALALYFFLLPYVVVSKWSLTRHETNGTLIQTLLVALGIFWTAFLIQLVHNVVQLRRGLRPPRGGSAWLAGLVVAVLPFLITPAASSATLHSTPVVHVPTALTREGNNAGVSHRLKTPEREPFDVFTGAVPMALIAKRRFDQLHQQEIETSDDDVDDVITLLRSYDPLVIANIRSLIGHELSGVVVVPHDLNDHVPLTTNEPILVRTLHSDEEGTHVAFAREGGQFRVPATLGETDLTTSCVALHEGRIVFERNVEGLLRALATRTLRNATVVYLGPVRDLDEELRACCITFERDSDAVPSREQGDSETETYVTDVASRLPRQVQPVRVELLRVDPQITGIVEPFTSSLRRRCVEMVAYLALHRGEPVTGERLRTRVLNYAKVDASTRTLANTASAVRRSLGADENGNRLHAVSSSGLYTTHGVTSDVEEFHVLVNRARTVSVHEAAPLAHQALQLVHGEPLASALRGFEWFLVEGSFAQLQRDGEWAALLVHHQAMIDEQYDLAFWSLRQGLLIDPYSDALTEALSQVPRSRQFGGDRSGRAQYETVCSSDAVAVGWSFNRLGDQIVQ